MIHEFELVTREFELVSRRFEIIICGFELVALRFEIIICGFELVTCGFEPVILNLNCHFNLQTLNLELVTYVSPYHQIFHLYIIDALRLFPASSHPIIARFLNVLFDFSSSCQKCNFRVIFLVSTK